MTSFNKLAFVLCCVALVFTTLAYGGVHQPVIAIFYLLISLGIIALSTDGLLNGRFEFNKENLQLPLLLAAVYAFIQIIPFGNVTAGSELADVPRTISLDPFGTWLTVQQMFACAAFFFVLLCCIHSASRIRRLFKLISIFGFGFAFFGILQSVLSPEKIYGIYDVSLGAPFGSFVNRNNFAAFMEMSVALPLGLVFAGVVKKEKRLLYMTAIVVMGVAIFLSRSRGGLVAFIAEIILLFFLTRRSTTNKGMLLRIASIVLLVLAIVAGAIFVGGDTSLSRVADAAASDDFSAMRSHIWSVAGTSIAEHMPLGAGFGAFAVAYTKFDDASGLARVEQAHNDYLQVLADAGIPGLLIGMLFLFLFFRHGREIGKIKNNYRRGIAVGAFAGCFAVLIHSIFDFVLHVTAVSLLFLTLLALLSASRKVYADDIEHEEKQHSRRRRSSSAESEIHAN
jgi:O-antigen ligase